MIDTAASVAPRDSDPVSPIITLAGYALYIKNPRSAPTSMKQNIPISSLPNIHVDPKLIIPNDRSVTINSTVVKTSAGAIYNQPIIKVSNLYSTISKLKKIGYWIVGTDMAGEDYTKIDYNMPVCLVIGNEGHGMSNIVRDNCDYIAKIPMIGKINSLNASVSCGIILSRIVASRIK